MREVKIYMAVHFFLLGVFLVTLTDESFVQLQYVECGIVSILTRTRALVYASFRRRPCDMFIPMTFLLSGHARARACACVCGGERPCMRVCVNVYLRIVYLCHLEDSKIEE